MYIKLIHYSCWISSSVYLHTLQVCTITHTFSRAIMTPKQYDSSLAMKCVDTLWLHTVNTNVAWLWVLGNIKVICSWMTGPCIEKVLWCNTRQCALPMGTHPDNPSPFVQGSIPIDLNDIGVVQWAEIVWFLPASLMQDKEDCKSIPLMFLPVFSPHLHLFNLGYSTMVSITSSGLKQKKKKSPARLKDDTSIAAELIRITCHRALTVHCGLIWR